MAHKDGKFVAAAGCMDSRAITAVQDFAAREMDADHVDIVAAEPGFVANGRPNKGILRKLGISRQHHQAGGLIVYGHQECAGDPVDDDTQRKQVLKTTGRFRRSLPAGIEVVPVFVERTTEPEGVKGWVGRRVPESQPTPANTKRGRKN